MKLERLNQWLKNKGQLAIAFSGGVDSTLLAGAARRLLGRDRVRLFLMDSLLLPRSEYDLAIKLALYMDSPLEIVSFEPLQLAEVRTNPKTRCYHCKKHLMSELIAIAAKRGFACMADGTNCDDCGDFRPGLQACDELGVVHPFLECQWSKEDIRRQAKEWGLPNWDLPAAACLASRIPTDTPLTPELLARIEAGEALLSGCGIVGGRVRAIDGRAQLELRTEKELETVVKMRAQLLPEFQALGFESVVLDLAGYRKGAMNFRAKNNSVKDPSYPESAEI